MKAMFLAAAAAAFLAAPAAAQRSPGSPEAAQPLPGASATGQTRNVAARGQTIAEVDDIRVNQLIVYGNDVCPASTEEEIIVCARRPESDRFRIPAPLRDDVVPRANSWANRAMELQYVGRQGIGSCSPTGPGGATGCLLQFINQARAERGGASEVNWNALIEQARRERLGRIDAESEEIEREQNPR